MPSYLCGFCSPTTYKNVLRRKPSVELKERLLDTSFSGEWGPIAEVITRNKSLDIGWARDDQLSQITEVESTFSRNITPNWEKTEAEAFKNKQKAVTIQEEPAKEAAAALNWKLTRRASFTRGPHQRIKIVQQELRVLRAEKKRARVHFEFERRRMSTSGSRTPLTPGRPIAPPSRELETIARIDASLKFEHFTTEDAWELGSALRERLLPIATPVVINISLANQNQTLFHTCTHSGVMPDNDNWVARKRKTVLRWGVSTWFMHCKFGGDEIAFREKYGLGNDAGSYAIHGGGVPIRVTGVEGVVAVVVVSGLKQDEDHGVIVEVIREMYY